MKTPLSQRQKDSVLEIFNIGVGAAAATLSEMVGEEVTLNLPGFDIVTRAELSSDAQPASSVSVIQQRFSSPFGSGRALLTFPEDRSLVLVEALMGQLSGTGSLTNLEREALLEVGNIILNASLASLASMLGQEIEVSIPRFHSVSHWALLFREEEDDGADALVLRLSIEFNLKSRRVDGRLLFLIELGHLLKFVESIEERLSGDAQIA